MPGGRTAPGQATNHIEGDVLFLSCTEKGDDLHTATANGAKNG